MRQSPNEPQDGEIDGIDRAGRARMVSREGCLGAILRRSLRQFF